MKKYLILLLVLLLLIPGCGKPKNEPSNTSNKTPSVVTSETPKQVDKNFIAPYTGENVTKSSYESIPFMTVIENLKAARPQAGLSSADVVFETLAEGGIPRFMAIFQSKSAPKIGPIRSDRVYFNELAKTFNLPFAHCGGSQTAIDEIKSDKLMSLNEMSNGKYYYRDKHKKAPHNLFTSSEKLTELINKKGYNVKPSFNLEFDNSSWQSALNKNSAKKINIKFSSYYSTAYTFQNGRYYKTMNKAKVPDRNTGVQLSAKNIIVQITKINPIPNDHKFRVNVQLTGSGTGYVFSNGLYKKIRWEKSSSSSPIKITDESGAAIKLSVGNTWWEIIDKKSSISFK